MAFTVTTFQSASQLATATGKVIVDLLDESQLEAEIETGDFVLTTGAYFTVVKGGLAAGTQVLGKGNLYTYIVEEIP